METAPKRVTEKRQQQLTRRHSAYEDASQRSSREENSDYLIPHESSVAIKRSLDAEEGVQHLHAKAAGLLRDRIKANRAGVKRLTLASGATPASFFTAAVLAVTAANSSNTEGDLQVERDHESAEGEYELMMERFQLRRLQHAMPNIFNTDTHIQVVYNPYQIAFHSKWAADQEALVAVLETVFLVDFVLHFNTSVIDARGTLVTSRSVIAYQYLSSWGIPHFVANIPLSSILPSTTSDRSKGVHSLHYVHMLYESGIRMQQIVQILQLYHRVGKLHVGRSSKSIWGWLLYSRYSHLMRLAWLIVAILLIAHYLACAWKLLQLPTSPVNADGYGVFEVYVACFYGAMQLLEGQGLPTETLAQNVFSSIAVLLGSVVLAVIYGHVTVLVSNFNANATGYQRKMEVVFAIMNKMQLPVSLRERIHQYYQHLWREYESLDGEVVKFSKDLTHNLALEVSLFKYMELTMHVPFWRMCSPDFQKHLVLSLHVRVYLPDDFVMRRGEVSDEFYMINRGVCEIIRGKDSFEHCTAALRTRHKKSTSSHAVQPMTTPRVTPQTGTRSRLRRDSGAIASTPSFSGAPDMRTLHSPKRSSNTSTMIDDSRRHSPTDPGSDTISTRLGRGQAFGEAALLLNYPRTANARAVTYVEMCILNRAAFQSMLARHPDDRKLVLEQMLTWLLANNEFHRVTCPLKQLVQDVLAEVDPGEACELNAAKLAGFMAEAIDPLIEAHIAGLLGLEQLKALPTSICRSSEDSRASVCSCSCCTTHAAAKPVQANESKTAQSAGQSTTSQGSDGSFDRTLLDSSLDSTDWSQTQTMQLVDKICRGVGTKPTSPVPLSLLPVLQPAATYGERRVSITRKRSMTSPMVIGPMPPVQEQGPVNISSTDESPSSSAPAEAKASMPRRDSVGSTRGPLLRQMTSLIGFSRSSSTSAVTVESPTRLVDQLFQQTDSAGPARPMKRLGTFHSLSLLRPND